MEEVQGRVSQTVGRLEGAGNLASGGNPSNMEDEVPQELDLKEQIEEQCKHSSRLQREVENMKLRNELEAEKLQQEQWKVALQQLKDARERMMQEHDENIEHMKSISTGTRKSQSKQAVAWLQDNLSSQGLGNTQAEEERERERAIEDLQRQQEQIQSEIEALRGTQQKGDHAGHRQGLEGNQGAVLEQLRAALSNKEEDRDQNRTIFKALLTADNKAPGLGGTTTLRTELLNKLGGPGEFSMAEWLASLNRQGEGELSVTKLLDKDDDSDCRQDCKHTRKSGMLDKSTTNIRHKEVWPQKNLGEDWVEEEIEFKQLKFEHLVAGETRTIETCTDPAQILGRLRLLR